jgi:hypothetical protein
LPEARRGWLGCVSRKRRSEDNRKPARNRKPTLHSAYCFPHRHHPLGLIER